MADVSMAKALEPFIGISPRKLRLEHSRGMYRATLTAPDGFTASLSGTGTTFVAAMMELWARYQWLLSQEGE